jgi:hypothetical protein
MLAVIFIILVLCIACFAYRHDGLGTAIFCSISISMLLFGITLLFVLATPSVEVSRQNVEFPIHSLKLNNNISGNFVLGSGQISTNTRYWYYVEDAQGFYKLAHNHYNSTRLKECENTDGFKPHGFYQVMTYKPNHWVSLWGSWRDETSLDLFVPKGTVIEQYNGN